MKKSLVILGGVVFVAAGAGYLFRGQLWDVARELITEDMYLAADTDNFDPGLPVGTQFPPVRAIHDGREINDTGRFIGDRGMVFIANRSADW